MQKQIITGLGEILWDLLPDGKKPGGAPANFVYHIQQLGYESYIVSAVGEDELGHEILDWMDKKNINKDYMARSDRYPTGKVEVTLDQNGDPEYNIIEDVAWDYIPYNSKIYDLAVQTSAVCFGTLAQRNQKSKQTIHKFLQNTSKNCIKIYDINLRQNYYDEELIDHNLQLSNVLKLNAEELLTLSEMFNIAGDESELLKKLQSRYDLELIALTKGSEGSRLWTAQESSVAKPRDTRVKDTVGAGDSFTAGLVSGLLKNLSLKECHANANLLASYVCSRDGATPAIPEDILAKLN